MTKDTGGQAFPKIWYSKDGVSVMEHHGMTLRDYFSAVALSGGMSKTLWNTGDCKSIAKRAYLFADAMIAEGKVK